MDESVLLLALSRMLDEKLQPIHCRLEGLEQTAAQLTAAAAGMSGELSALAVAIKNRVKALVKYQQAQEIAMNAATTMDELNAIVVDYDSVQ